MKTTNILYTLSFVLILTAAVTSVSLAGVDQKNNPAPVNTMIRLQVNVILLNEKPLCNFWMVEIRDGNGNLVAPAKPYTTGVTRYDFFERGPANGSRIAVLAKYRYGDHYVCETEIFTNPSVLFGPFCCGQTYRLSLIHI